MKRVFADTLYWVGLANPTDPWHSASKAAATALGSPHQIITTDEVLSEVLSALCRWGPELRGAAVALVERVRANSNVQVVHRSRASFTRGFSLYKSRMDKRYSLVDCISMETMRSEGLSEVLTHDHHFTQEGFTVLIT